MSKMLIVSPEFHCSQEILAIVAMLSGGWRLIFTYHRLIEFDFTLQFPTFGCDQTINGKKPMPQSKY